uniref:Uncharacterized protein n=1 Tax=Rhizophora mucronata TaxID=61149 RepID=A0A2P2MC33_RHIMU
MFFTHTNRNGLLFASPLNLRYSSMHAKAPIVELTRLKNSWMPSFHLF